MSRIYRFIRFSTLVIVSLHLVLSAGMGAELVTVHLTSGRSFSGEVDARSTENQLWLRFVEGSTMILRRISWDRVAGVQTGDSVLSSDELRAQIANLASVSPRTFRFEERYGLGADESKIVHEIGSRATHGAPRDFMRPGGGEPVAPVRSVAIDAYVANWDADVEVDGIALHVYPLDGTGLLTPTTGSLEATLIGQYSAGYTARGQFQTLGRWARSMRSAEHHADGFVFHLPFQAVHPEFARDLWKTGLLHVRLSVPGHGVFDASAAALRIRPYSPVRDRLEQVEDRRFFPIERTGRTH